MSDDTSVEYTESGVPILRHKPRETAFEPVSGFDGSEFLPAIDAHIEQYVGTGGMVFHELVSDLVHLDVHIVPPTPERNYYTLVTSGMSDRPMTTPPQAKGWEYAELVLCLPPTWKLSEGDLRDENNYWVIRWLKTLARLPHEYNTWLALGHTVPNQDPPQPFAPNTRLSGAFLAPPLLFDPGFSELAVNDAKTIRFYAFVPLYTEEMNWKLKHGTDSLYEKLRAINVTELLDINRPNTCEVKKGFRFFGRG